MGIVVDKIRIWKKNISNWRVILIIGAISFMIIAIGMMYSVGSNLVDNGKVDLKTGDFNQNESVALDGQWEFYWDRLLTPEDFILEDSLNLDSFMRVPGSWNDGISGAKVYADHGVATYRLKLKYPSNIKDPALRIQRVITAYKLYANGELIQEVGKVSDKLSDFEAGYKFLILDLPKDKEEIELIIQVANLNYSRGGIRESPVFGSKQVLERQKMLRLAIQILFIGSVLIFGIYYFLLFILQRKNKTALIFSIICINTALHSLVWGEAPLSIFFPNIPLITAVVINYIAFYNMIPGIILLILNIYPLDYNKKMAMLILIPTIFFEGLLLTPPSVMAKFNNYFSLLMGLQMIYILGVLIKAVMRRRDNAILMFIAIGLFALATIEDALQNKAISGINISYMFLYGNFILIIAMSYIQARQQSNTHKKLILYNEKLIEADMLKDKIMETEMSFLQAQIKPHFLYNALNAIANVCEKNGKNAGKLIIDLAIYLRASLEFNNLDKMVTIDKELDFVDTYFNIEQARFGEKIQLIKEVQIPLNYLIPVLILQPLVENAVRHGISKNLKGGRVYVRMRQTKEDVYLEIEDNGVGMDNEKLETLLSEDGIRQGVGLLNIHHRLLRLYGKGLDISSKVGGGTLVRLVIPERRKQL